jgi:hypothetical protein
MTEKPSTTLPATVEKSSSQSYLASPKRHKSPSKVASTYIERSGSKTLSSMRTARKYVSNPGPKWK